MWSLRDDGVRGQVGERGCSCGTRWVRRCGVVVLAMGWSGSALAPRCEAAGESCGSDGERG
jgi:hypothetical protein